MNHKNGIVFALGHAAIPIVLAGMYVSGEHQLILIPMIAVSFIWFLLLCYSSLAIRVLAEWLRKKSVWLIMLIDIALCCVIQFAPNWQSGVGPHWLILFLVPLYAFELGTGPAIVVGLSGIVYLTAFHSAMQIPFATLDMFVIIGGIGLLIFFIGPSTDRLNRLAYYDLLTGLPNRHLFRRKLNAALLAAKRDRHPAGIMFVDLDQFKYVNDNMGHDAGDQLLKVVTGRIRGILPSSALLARMGGDEFMILLQRMTHSDDAANLAAGVIDAMRESISVNYNEVFLTTSIGIALYPGDAKDAASLMRHAETAMYKAKEEGRNNYQFYSDQMIDEGTAERVRMETMLRHAIERDEFVVYYQPRLNTKTGELVCVEALARWRHPERGMIQPKDFIPLAEDTGLIVTIGEQVLRKACQQRKLWTEQGMPPFRVSVNLSARQFRHTDLPETIASILKSTGIPADLLELEITESAAMQDVNYASSMLRVLKESGLSLAIDDFGTGYSSLSYLKRFPIDVIKIDRSFISGIHKDSDDAAIVRAIIVLAKTLKLEVTAEGVETSEQISYLERLGCDEIQGFVIGKPMEADDLTRWHFVRQEDLRTG